MLRFFKQYYPIRNIFFVVGEGLFIYISVLMALLLKNSPATWSLCVDQWYNILLITVICQVSLYYNDLYDLNITNSFTELGIRLFQALGSAAIALAFIYFIFPQAIIGKGIFILSICFIILLIVSWRFLYAFILDRGLFNQRIILLGSGQLVWDIMSEINGRKDSGYGVLVLDKLLDVDESLTDKKNAFQLKGKKYNGLYDMARDLRVRKIVEAFTEKRGVLPSVELLKCRVAGIDVLNGISFCEMLYGKLRVEFTHPAWLIYSEGFKKSVIQRFVKRLVDLIVSSMMLIALLPVMVFVAILIKLDSEGPVFFSQSRLGRKRKPYRIYKFRSMVDKAEKDGPVWAQNDDCRVTKVGMFIRKWRIDEIPQIWNVLKGDMSFVGPRPERDFFVKKLEEQIPYYSIRFTVKPGITGWAQISYGYSGSIEEAKEKLNYELFYIKNMSILMDFLIIARTIKTVIFGVGAR